MRKTITKSQRLELQFVLVILLCLGTMALMAGTLDKSSQTASGPVSAAAANPSAAGIIRFHIIANSDSPEDQALKLEVRNQVLSRIQTLLAGEISREMAEKNGTKLSDAEQIQLTRSFLTKHLPQIEEWAETAVSEEGFSYAVQGELGIRWIPDREYDGIFFPAGNYEALTLTIGEGSGQNWWCVIYPPLCLIDSSDTLRKELGEARFQAWLDTQGDGRIVLKSRIAEILSRK